MATTDKEYRVFVREPMGDKPVTDLPGIEETLGRRLQERGFYNAYKVLGQFVWLRRDTDRFTTWLKKAIGATSEQADLCARALEDWCTIQLY
ncbi:barrier-to-autointegration factor-like protein [Cololabis saira]|uniref:barrier-to-autointegration factor-like protein n=1 Tax=Cololabis saira TaxID=129043 RepID=UPI002AD2C7E0|nr:barrier-to-autointegration factor-like protein [Cololabis saira]